MNSSYICTSCRRALAHTRRQTTSQWSSRRNFISLSDNSPAPRTATDDGPPNGIDPLRSRKEVKDAGSQHKQSQKSRSKSKLHSPDSLESFFQNSLQPPTSTPRQPQGVPPAQPPTVLNLYKNVDTLRKMLLEGGNEADAWLFFVEHFGPHSEKHAFDKSIVSRALLKDVTLAKRKHPLSTHLPSVTEVSTISYQLGLLNAADWSNMVMDLIENILVLKASSTAPADDVDRLMADLIGAWNVVCRPASNMQDLPTYESTSLDWSHLPSISLHSAVKVFRRDGTQKCFTLLTPSFHHRQAGHIPVLAVATFKLLMELATSKSGVLEAGLLKLTLASLIRIPGFYIEQSTSLFERPADRAVFDYASLGWEGLQQTANLMFGSLSPNSKTLKTLNSGFVTQNDLPAATEGVGDDYFGAGAEFTTTVRTNDNTSHGLESREPTPPTEDRSTISNTDGLQTLGGTDFRRPLERATKASIQNMRTKLDKAVRERDVGEADRLWAAASHWRFQAKSNEENVKKHGGGVLTIYLMNKFLYGFMALRQPNRAIDVWNAMMKNEVRPDTEAWNSMLSGGRISRDAQAFDKIWQQMCSRNVTLTKESWNIRIAGLIDMWKIQDGLRTLDEMGRLWLATAQAQYPKFKQEELFRLEESMIKGVVKPSIETVNMTVAALLKKKNGKAVRPVLTWAARFGIAPSAFTYNVLLRPLIRAGDTTGAMALIKEMKAAGVSPDAGTFVTIIDEAFRSDQSYTAEEQAAAVDHTFAEMEAVGLEPTQGLYGHIIHGLIDNLTKHGSTDLSVVNTVMARMASQGWQPGSIEFTELAKFLFDQNPPDIAGVDQLIARSRLGSKSLSHIFWDSVLEGYARTGETAKALQVYKESKQKGGWQADHSRIAWRALRELVMALTRDGDFQTAKAVVAHKVMENEGVILPPDHNTRTDGHVSQFAFWQLARDLDLLDAPK